MAKFLYAVLAELTPAQKTKVRSWMKPETYPEARKISDHVFGSKTRQTLPEPIEHGNANHVQDWIHEHTPFKTSTDHYRKGFAFHGTDSEQRRPYKIGRVLEQYKAPEDVKRSYMNDPTRSKEIPVNQMTATVSRHPYDIAGMSTNRQWKSCMGMSPNDRNTGGNHSTKLKQDLKYGTHVAYLHPSDDHKIDRPVSRIALKPFHSLSSVGIR